MPEQHDTTCPLCGAPLVHVKRIFPGQVVRGLVPCHYECDRCGYQEEAPPLTRRDLKKLIRDRFPRRDHPPS